MEKNYSERINKKSSLEREINILKGKVLLTRSDSDENKKLSREIDEKIKEYKEMSKNTQSDNLRYAISELMKERGEGFDVKALAEDIGYTEFELYMLLNKGITTSDILNSLCSYFDVIKIKDWERYTVEYRGINPEDLNTEFYENHFSILKKSLPELEMKLTKKCKI